MAPSASRTATARAVMVRAVITHGFLLEEVRNRGFGGGLEESSRGSSSLKSPSASLSYGCSTPMMVDSAIGMQCGEECTGAGNQCLIIETASTIVLCEIGLSFGAE